LNSELGREARARTPLLVSAAAGLFREQLHEMHDRIPSNPIVSRTLLLNPDPTLPHSLNRISCHGSIYSAKDAMCSRSLQRAEP